MKQFSQEFKASVIERIRNGESQMGVAKSQGISCKTVNNRKIAEKLLKTSFYRDIDSRQVAKLGGGWHN